MKKLILTTLSLFALLAAAGSTLTMAQVPLADAADQFSVSSPGPNSIVKGTWAISWKAYDDDQDPIPYEIILLSGSKCTSVVGTIASGNTASSTQSKSTSWATGGPIVNKSSIADGKYCLQVCVSFLDGGNAYSACNSRFVTVRNHNSNPQITSAPPSDRTIFTDESWSYDVNASDANGDKLTYSLSQAPGFLSINSSSGVISTNSRSKSVGAHTVKVTVTDGFGGLATQQFTLTVQVRPDGGGTTSTTSSATTSAVALTEIKVARPNQFSELFGDTNQVVWEVVPPNATVAKFTLSYFSAGIGDAERQDLAEVDGEERTYNWDVSKVTDGSYQLVITGEDLKGSSVSGMSDVFNINNKLIGNGGVSTKALIINVLPADGAQTVERQPIISGEFSPPIDGGIDPNTFAFYIDDVDRLTWCTSINQEGFECKPTVDMQLGSHKLRAAVKDTNSQIAVKEWTFEIVEELSPAVSGASDVINLFGREFTRQSVFLAGLICCLALILFLVPWVLFIMWRRRREEDEHTYTYPEYIPASAAQPEVEVNYDYSAYQPTSSYYEPLITPTSTEQAASPVPEPATPVTETRDFIQPAESYYAPTETVTEKVSEEPDWLKGVEPTREEQPEVEPVIVDGPIEEVPAIDEPSPKEPEVPLEQVKGDDQPKPIEQPIDPAKFNTYEEYLEAMGVRQPSLPSTRSTTVPDYLPEAQGKGEEKPEDKKSSPDFITPPDYNS